VNKFYSKSDEDNMIPSKDELISRLNRAYKLEDFEMIIKNIQDDIGESTMLEGT